jgi:hypothetical protein
MADDGGRKEERGSCDGGGSGPIYRLEGFGEKQMVPGGGRPGPGRLDGEVAEGAAASGMVRRRGSLPEVQELVC